MFKKLTTVVVLCLSTALSYADFEEEYYEAEKVTIFCPLANQFNI